MPAILANANSFLANSDYPMDKVVYLKSGSDVCDNHTIVLAHGLPFAPLINGYWSFTSDFSTCYEFSSGTFPSPNPSFLFSRTVEVQYADTTNIRLPTTDLVGDSKPFYYRIFGFQPDDSNVLLPPLMSSGDNFFIDTDYNMMKLYQVGHVTVAPLGSATVTHGLGYLPHMLLWVNQGSTGFTPITYGSDSTIDTITNEVTTTSVIFTNTNSFQSSRFDYRIYTDI